MSLGYCQINFKIRSTAVFPITKLQTALNCDQSTETQTDNWE